MTTEKTQDESKDVLPYWIENPEDFARNMMQLLEEGSRTLSLFLERSNGNGPYSVASEAAETTRALSNVAQQWIADPVRFSQAQSELFHDYAQLWSSTFQKFAGAEPEPVAKPTPSDNRFKDPEWSQNPYFDFWKQSYLILSHWAEEKLDKTDGLDPRAKAKAEFYLRQLLSALSPSNFPVTNPEVMRETFATNGGNLVQGMRHLREDLCKSGDILKISQTDVSAFKVGENLAVTAGKVVYQNEVMQLIQYSPTTESVHEVPLLIVPPWINKYYILDLTQPKSFVKFAIDQGFTVFIVSWVNPDTSLAGKTFEDYMTEGVLAATDAVERETGKDKINILGYCVGGTLVSATLAYLAERGQAPYNSATFLTTQVDFTRAGDLLVFIDDTQLAELEEMMAERGYLDGSRMATVFNLLRPKDLIWPYIVNNYLLGKKPFPFDLLYWNQDSTRMPAANHAFYLREFYHNNKLAKGEMELCGKRLDLSKVTLPIYELATREDHIAPAESVFLGSKLFGGPVEFVLAGSGHIAGVVNPPDPKRVKYQHWTGGTSTESVEKWVQTATEHPGSWWPHWAQWLAGYSGDKMPARTPGQSLGVIENAPGSYVLVSS